MYKILPLKKKIEKSIRELPPAYRNKLKDAFQEIETSPYYHPTGKISPFKGNLKHLGWHYDLSDNYRIHYEIDEATKEITITYIGPHPKYK
ncbi:hypothetical protein SAMN02745221_02144 [Thermosyntropha lipolytica DSM 11003]|uniref:mRNA-degrading endonuclease RelE, toxin component of the RelBE toxin-antitoxin system n=1 Tax=Thermosyntropha lipolytica DSM 11003 TaxID=1123382 RepID=A0A1M5S0E5_9FIRM|nr:hypothetical protein [Thermosyntropha lipolytica]SHH31904.1 hypothetical protein SAMN02745221_02144 [Thermosyntropha lipolytica DSM 11003]